MLSEFNSNEMNQSEGFLWGEWPAYVSVQHGEERYNPVCTFFMDKSFLSMHLAVILQILCISPADPEDPRESC